jgi:archaellum component FlaD/FlaE
MHQSLGSRPYLETPIDTDRTETLIRWVKYLGTTFGTGGALNALRYYERLSWITAGARRELERQLKGLSLEEIHSKKYDEPGQLEGPLSPLSGTPFGAHAKSLAFIAALAGDDLEEEMLRVEIAKRRTDVELQPPEDRSADNVQSSGE